MKDRTITKLAHVLGDDELAEELVRAGFVTPRQIKAATDGQLDAVLGKATREAVRAVLPHFEQRTVEKEH